MKLFPFIFKPRDHSSWTWPTCTNSLKTLSFRANNDEFNLTHLRGYNTDTIESDKNYHDNCNHKSVSSDADDDQYYLHNDDEYAVTKGLRSSDRLFFEPGSTSSILDEAKPSSDNSSSSRKGSSDVSVLEMESVDPISDFRGSMEEMVEAHGLKSWDSLEKLLARYLRLNEKRNHGYVIGAFVDLMFDLGLDQVAYCDDDDDDDYDDDDCSTSNCAEADGNDEVCCLSKTNEHKCSFKSPMSFCSSSCCSSTSPGMSSLRNLMNDENVANIVDDDRKNVYSCSSSLSS